MILFPSAKINLGLKVLGKREDGYHELETCMYNIPLFDVLEILPATEFSFHQTGLIVEGDPEQNLVVKAYRLMQENYSIGPIAIHLLKNIPMGAGLGGGSSDAAFMIRGLNELFKLELSNDQLRDLAAQLGSDCPFFIEDIPQLATGRGEILKPFMVELGGFYLKIMNPGIHVGTAEAYSGVSFSDVNSKCVSGILQQPIESWRQELINDFESTIFKKHPELTGIKETMYKEGAIYASMSGSGSTMYAIFEKEPCLTFPNYFEKIVRM